MHNLFAQIALAAFLACSTQCLEGGARMNLGARTAMWSGGAKMPTARDYMQGSLADAYALYYNFYENSGLGVHDDDPDILVDLSGSGWNMPMAHNGNYEFVDDYILLKGTGGAGRIDGARVLSNSSCMIIVENLKKKHGVILDWNVSARDYFYTDTQGYVNFGSPLREGWDALNKKVSLLTTGGAFYVNGVEQTVVQYMNDYWNFVAMTLGSRGSLTDTISPNAKVWEIRLFNRALTEDEITYISGLDKIKYGLS